MTTVLGKLTYLLSPVTDRVTALFGTRRNASPIFNQPHDSSACPHHRRARMLFGVFLPLLVMIAIPVVTLKVFTYDFIEDNQMQGFIFQTTTKTGDSDGNVVLAALPEMLQRIPANIALFVGVFSIFLAGAHLGFVISDWGSGKRTQSYAFRRNIMFLHIVNSLLILFTLISVLVTHKNTSHFRDGYVSSRAMRVNDTDLTENAFRYNLGHFDLETWACELRDERGASMVKDDYNRQCNIEIAGRAIMIPLLIMASIVAGVGIWGMVGGGRRGPDGERMKTVDMGLELDKMENTS